MSKVTKNVNQMCSSITNVQKRPTIFCQGTISRIKLAISGGENLYELAIGIQMRKLLPAITNPDIGNYLLFTTSPYTADDLKS